MKKSIIIIVVIALLATVVFYFSQSSKDSSYAKQAQCAEIAQKMLDKDTYEVAHYSDGTVSKPSDMSTILDPVFHYNSNLNRCFYGREIVSPDGNETMSDKAIYDVLANKKVLYADTFSNRPDDFGAINYLDSIGGTVIKDSKSFEDLYASLLSQ